MSCSTEHKDELRLSARIHTNSVDFQKHERCKNPEITILALLNRTFHVFQRPELVFIATVMGKKEQTVY